MICISVLECLDSLCKTGFNHNNTKEKKRVMEVKEVMFILKPNSYMHRLKMACIYMENMYSIE